MYLSDIKGVLNLANQTKIINLIIINPKTYVKKWIR